MNKRGRCCRHRNAIDRKLVLLVFAVIIGWLATGLSPAAVVLESVASMKILYAPGEAAMFTVVAGNPDAVAQQVTVTCMLVRDLDHRRVFAPQTCTVPANGKANVRTPVEKRGTL